MEPQLPQQLGRISDVLRQVIAPAVADPYARDVLNGLTAALATLAGGAGEHHRFLRWDAGAAASVLAASGIATPCPPEDPLDLAALEDHHRAVRAALADAMPQIVADPAARRRMASYARDRLDRNPYATALPKARGR
jgi:hypothetical protein